ncbi:MAG: FHA domain-containing protein [Anaerolineales bacterium]|nr:FHA domain-containing protein [Anaerolineales bacterium]
MEWVLLILRLGASACLLLFIGAVGFMLWRDQQLAAAQADERRGRLIVLTSDVATIRVGQSWALLPMTTLVPDEQSDDRAQVTWRSGQWWLEILNGTVLLNSQQIEQPTQLTSGDVIGFARVRLLVELV